MARDSGSQRKDPAGNVLPRRLRWKHGRYWYVHKDNWRPLERTYAASLAIYNRIMASDSGFGGLVDRALAHTYIKVQTGAMAEATWQQYNQCAEVIKRTFAEFQPSEITQAHVSQFHDFHAKKRNMANRYLTVLRIVMDCGVRWGEMPYNAAASVKRHQEDKRTRYVTDAEYAAIRASARTWVKLLMDMLYLTGQRIDDVLALRLADISDEGIYFQQKKTGSRISVAMTAELSDLVREIRALHGGRVAILSPYLFHPRGKAERYSYYTARDAYRLAVEAAKVKDTTLHDIRAKSLTDADSEGKDAQRLAGHSSAAMTKRYLRLRKTEKVQGPRLRVRDSLGDS